MMRENKNVGEVESTIPVVSWQWRQVPKWFLRIRNKKCVCKKASCFSFKCYIYYLLYTITYAA